MYPIRSWLYVGKFAETRNIHFLQNSHIDAMLQLAAPCAQPGIEHLYLPVEDGYPLPHDKIKKGVQFVLDHHQKGHTVLIACGAGISRSVTFTMAVLMEAEKLSIFDAYREVYRWHCGAFPHHELFLSLAAYHGLELSLMEMWDGLRAVQKEFQSQQ